jgi:sulfoxide reductase catalytic subunit YedY
MVMSKTRQSITRRHMLRLALAGGAAALLDAACQPGVLPTLVTSPTTTPLPPAPSPAVAPPSAATPGPSAPAAVELPPLPKLRPAILRNRDDTNYNVRYVNPFKPVDHAAWRLEVEGLVESPDTFRLEELMAWPQMEQVSRMKCVECWSYKAKWGGFHYTALAERVAPKPEATHVRFDCADEYWEIASIEELMHPRVIFVLRMNDQPLLDEYGAPLRMMFPAKYGYKSAKAVTRVSFINQDTPGFWSTVGPYTTHGDIQPGVDRPQDLPGERKEIEGGEITAY